MNDLTHTSQTAWLEFQPALGENAARLVVGGPWIIAQAAELDAELIELPQPNGPLTADLGQLTRLDTAGACVAL